jgi:hypothetical protein
MDDPGWGGFTPLPPEADAGAGAGPPPATSQPPPPPGGSGRRPPKLALMIGGAVVVAAALVGVGVALSGGGKTNASNTTLPGVASSTTVAPTSTTAAPSTTGGPTTTLISKTDFITKADAICQSFQARTAADDNSGNAADLAQVAQAEIDQIRALGPPDQDAALITTLLSDVAQAASLLQQGDFTNANNAIVQADTVAGQFGMHVCNYGH